MCSSWGPTPAACTSSASVASGGPSTRAEGGNTLVPFTGYISGHEDQWGCILPCGFGEAGPRPLKPGLLELGGRPECGWVGAGGGAEVPASGATAQPALVHTVLCPVAVAVGSSVRSNDGQRPDTQHCPWGCRGAPDPPRQSSGVTGNLHLQPRGRPSSVRPEAVAGPGARLPVPSVPRPLQGTPVPTHVQTAARAPRRPVASHRGSCPGMGRPWPNVRAVRRRSRCWARPACPRGAALPRARLDGAVPRLRDGPPPGGCRAPPL